MTTQVLPTEEPNKATDINASDKVVRDQAESAVFVVTRVKPSYSKELPDGIMPYA